MDIIYMTTPSIPYSRHRQQIVLPNRLDDNTKYRDIREVCAKQVVDEDLEADDEGVVLVVGMNVRFPMVLFVTTNSLLNLCVLNGIDPLIIGSQACVSESSIYARIC